MTTASSRAAEINAELDARIAAAAALNGVVLIGRLTEDAAHWADLGVHTGAELDQYLAWEGYVDLHKEVRNIKPRWTNWRERTAAEWDAAADDLASELDELAAEISWEESRGIY